MQENILKPCPFCGGEAQIHNFSEDFSFLGESATHPSFFVACVDCDGGHPPVGNEAEAIAVWHQRA